LDSVFAVFHGEVERPVPDIDKLVHIVHVGLRNVEVAVYGFLVIMTLLMNLSRLQYLLNTHIVSSFVCPRVVSRCDLSQQVGGVFSSYSLCFSHHPCILVHFNGFKWFFSVDETLFGFTKFTFLEVVFGLI